MPQFLEGLLRPGQLSWVGPVLFGILYKRTYIQNYDKGRGFNPIHKGENAGMLGPAGLGRLTLENARPAHVPVEVDGATFTVSVSLRPLLLCDLVAGSVWILVGGTFLLLLAIEQVPAWGHDQQLFQAGEREPLFVNQLVDSLDLEDVEIRIDPVVRFRFSKGFDQAFALVFPDPFLREVHLAGDIIDEVLVRSCLSFVHGSSTVSASGE